MKKAVHYVNNKDLLAAMTEYKNKVNDAVASGNKKPRIPEYVGKCIQLIADRTSRRGNFSGYSFREEMVSDGIENCIRYIDNFDPAKFNNPFGYFGKIIWYAFVRRIEREKKERYVKLKNMQMNYVAEGLEESGNLGDSSFFDNEITADFIRSYEEKLEEKKRRATVVDKDNEVD